MPVNPLFVGPSYELKLRRADVQRSVNLMPVDVEADGKIQTFLQEIPGLRVFTVTPTARRWVLVSWPYPITFSDAVDVSHSFASGELIGWPIEGVDTTHAMLDGELTPVLISYQNGLPEAVDLTHSMLDSQLVVVLETYPNYPPEGVDLAHSMLDGQLTLVLVTYSNYPAEGADFTHAMLDGELT